MKLLDKIAEAGPARPMGDQEGDFKKAVKHTSWQGFNEEELRRQYVGAPERVFRRITPLWDLSEEAKNKNECDPEYLSRCSLYNAAPTSLIPRMLMSRHYIFDEFWKAGFESRFLRVLGLWQEKIQLPPPVIRPRPTEEGVLVKIDGFHRLALAVISGSPSIPFYCCFNEVPEGIGLMNSETDTRYTPKDTV